MANKRNDNFELGFSMCATDGARLDCYDSRQKDTHRWRRYRCPECGVRHTTYEISQTEYDALVIKQSKITVLVRKLKNLL